MVLESKSKILNCLKQSCTKPEYSNFMPIFFGHPLATVPLVMYLLCQSLLMQGLPSNLRRKVGSLNVVSFQDGCIQA